MKHFFLADNIVCPPQAKRGRIQELFSRDLRGQTIFASVVWFLQSMGFWSVTMYLPEYMGTLDIDPYLNSFSVFIGEIPGLLLAMVLIDPSKLGRIKCLRFFSFFTALGLLLFAFIDVKVVRAICVVLVFFFMVPIYSILNTFTPEVFPTDHRSIAMAWMYMVIAFPGIITAFLGASVLSTNITWLYPAVAASFFCLQLLFTFGLRTEPAAHGLIDSKDILETGATGLVTESEHCIKRAPSQETELADIPTANGASVSCDVEIK